MVAVAQIVESFAYGTAKSVQQICQFLPPTDKLTVFYGYRQGTELDIRELDRNVRWLPLPGSGTAKHLTNLRFLNQCLREGFDVVHGHSTFGGYYAKLLGPRIGIATLYSPRGYPFLRQDFSKQTRWLFRKCEQVTSTRCLTVCCGPYEHDIAQKLGGQSVRINNGFHLRRPREAKHLNGGVLGVGRICFQKGFDIFIDIARQLPQIQFTWVGDLQSADGRQVKNLPTNLTILKYMAHPDILKHIEYTSLILLPSRWEGLSRFLIESVCMGKAIVTSPFQGNLDCLEPCPLGTGYTNGFACSNLDEYVQSVQQLCTNDSLLNHMQAASSIFAANNFNIEDIANQWRYLYHSLA